MNVKERAESLLSRKFIYAVGSVLLVYTLVFSKAVSGEEFLGFVKFIGFSYILGNVVQKAVLNGK